jgi:hypothetical protein
MTRIGVQYDEATAIPLPGAELPAEGVEEWATTAADRIASLHGFEGPVTRTLVRVLTRAQRSAAADPATNLMLHEPGTGAWTPLRLTLAELEPDEREQRRYLWPPSVLAPRLRIARSTGLGIGCSSTILEEDGVAQVRWLFATTGRSLLAVLGPVAPPVLAMTAARVEDLLDTVRIDDAVWAPSELFDAYALVQPSPEKDVLWRI